MTLRVSMLASLAARLLDARAARIGVGIGALSFAAMLLWAIAARPSLCAYSLGILTYAEQHSLVAFAVLVMWSFLLFHTVLPLGTITILLAGYMLGPAAGLAQFVSLTASSIILFELGREADRHYVERQLAAFPNISRLVASARHRGVFFTVIMRLAPVVPTAVTSLSASYLGLSRRDFLSGTLLAGWVRPVVFAALGSLGRFAPVCGIDPAAGTWPG